MCETLERQFRRESRLLRVYMVYNARQPGLLNYPEHADQKGQHVKARKAQNVLEAPVAA